MDGFNVTLTAVSTDRREVSFSGLPSGYVLSPGDMFAFTYGSNPTRYAMHRIVAGSTASGLGTTSDNPAEVVPPLRDGFTLGAAVTLVRPAFKAIISRPQYGTRQGVITSGASFDFVQTLR